MPHPSRERTHQEKEGQEKLRVLEIMLQLLPTLIDEGTDVNQKTLEGNEPLLAAAARSYPFQANAC